jgi:membrane protease YdiL (CAAX protease family)
LGQEPVAELDSNPTPTGGGQWVGEMLALVFAMLFPTAVAFLYFLVLSRNADAAGNRAMQAVYSGGKIIQFAFPIVYFSLVGVAVKPRRPSFAGLTLGLGFGLFTAALILAIYHSPLSSVFVTDQTAAMVRQKVGEMLGEVTPFRYLMLAAFLALGHSLLEEYYWRWYVFGSLEQIVPLVWAMVISAFGFMAHHVIVLAVYFPGRFLTLALPLSLCIAAGGIVWAWLYHYSGSIYAPWLSHLLVDAAIMVVGYDLLFHPASW